MRAITKVLAGGVAAAALFGAAPAAAQYYPGYPGYGYGGNPVGQIVNQLPGGGNYGGYGNNQQAVIQQCAAAVQQRLGSGYGNGYGGGHVLAISRVEPRSNGGLTIRGVATSGRYAGNGYGGGYGGAYGGGYGGQAPADLSWKCRTDYRGFITDIDVNLSRPAYGGNYNYAPDNNGQNYDYSQYGYRRY